MLNMFIHRGAMLLRHRQALLAVGCFYILFHACIFTLNNFTTDDYMQRVYAVGSSELDSAGLLDGIRAGDLNFFINNQFNFFDPQSGNDVAMRNYGALPWWLQERAMLHLWRPVSSLTHWLDYQLWPDSPRFMQWQNGIWLFSGFLFVALMYKQLLPSGSVFILALLIYGLDISIAPVAGWIAARNSLLVIFFLGMTLYCFHRSFTDARYYVAAIIGLLLALLSAEAGIVVVAYLVAYVLFFPAYGFRKKCLFFVPFILMTVLWRWFYHAQGFGAFNIGQYIDPARLPFTFISHAITQFPLLFIEVATGIDAVEVLSSFKHAYVFTVTGWALFFAFLMIAVLLHRKEKQILFWFFSSVLSLAPGLMMYSTDPRVVIYAHIAFSVFIALLIVAAIKPFKHLSSSALRLRCIVISPLIFFHIVLQFIAVLFMNYAVLFTQALTPAQSYNDMYGFRSLVKPDDNAIIINHRDVFRLMYYPYIAVYEHFPLPRTVRQMNTAQTAMVIRRSGEHSYIIEPEGGFVFHPRDMASLSAGQQQSAASAGYAIKYAVFFHDGDYRFQAGDTITLPEMDIAILAVDLHHRPLSVEMRLHANKHYPIVYWDWPSRTYKRLTGLVIGEAFYIAGPS